MNDSESAARRKDNLKTFQTGDERAKECQKKSSASRTRNVNVAKTFQRFLSMPIKPGQTADIKSISNLEGIETENITVEEAIVMNTIKRSLEGNDKATKMILDYIDKQKTKDTEMKILKKQYEKLELEVDMMREQYERMLDVIDVDYTEE